MSLDMPNVANALVTCLSRQADELRILLELHARRRDIPRGSDGRDPGRLTAALCDSAASSAQLERERQSLTQRLIELGSLAPAPEEQAEIARLIEVSRTSMLAQLHEQLYRLWEDVEHRRSINTALVERSTRAARDTLRWIARTIPARSDAAGLEHRARDAASDRKPG